MSDMDDEGRNPESEKKCILFDTITVLSGGKTLMTDALMLLRGKSATSQIAILRDFDMHLHQSGRE